MQEHFAFFKTYELAFESLPNDEQRIAFMRKLFSYGLHETIPPETNDQASLYFHMVAEPILTYSHA